MATKQTYHICTIWAGTAQASMLEALQELPFVHLSAVVCTTDNGWHTWLVRKDLNIPGPWDTRNCINHLTKDDGSMLAQLLQYRFCEGELKGTHLGNLIIWALSRIHGSFEEGIEKLNQALQMRHDVFPVSWSSTQIWAVLEDGTHILWEWDIIKRTNKSPIVSMYLDPPAAATSQVIHAIQEADMIIICPGVLCTALWSVLLHDWIKETIKASSAPLIHFSNLFTKPNQTEWWTLSRHIDFIEHLVWRSLDYVIANERPNEFVVEYYQKKWYELVHIDTQNIDQEKTELIRWTFIHDTKQKHVGDLERVKTNKQHISPHLIRSDGKKVRDIIEEIKTKNTKIRT